MKEMLGKCKWILTEVIHAVKNELIRDWATPCNRLKFWNGPHFLQVVLELGYNLAIWMHKMDLYLQLSKGGEHWVELWWPKKSMVAFKAIVPHKAVAPHIVEK